MSRPERGEPRWLHFSKSRDRKIIALLSGLPRLEPDISLAPLTGADFPVYFGEYYDGITPAEPGKSAYYAEYDVSDHQLLEATILQTARRVKAEGMWCLETYSTGGYYFKGKFELGWKLRGLLRLSPEYYYSPSRLAEECGRCPRRFANMDDVRWTGDQSAEGPEDGTHSAGYCTVTVGEVAFDCMRLIQVCQDDTESDISRLDISYVTREGRMVLNRTFRSQQDYAEEYEFKESLCAKYNRQMPGDMPAIEEWATGRSELVYNGSRLNHWFDTLTDYTLKPVKQA